MPLKLETKTKLKICCFPFFRFGCHLLHRFFHGHFHFAKLLSKVRTLDADCHGLSHGTEDCRKGQGLETS